MPITVGAIAPDFTLPDQHGDPVTLTALLAQGPVVLFFFPAAGTPVCTKEVCHFRDLDAAFAAVGAQRVGISKDSVETQRAFAEEHAVSYPLLSDPDGSVAARFGVRPKLFGRIGPLDRVTFTLGADGRVRHVSTGFLNATVHADEALAELG